MQKQAQTECVHDIGIAGNTSLSDMGDQAIVDYVERVQYFNAYTDRFEVRHPGHLSFHKFCPLCGKALPRDQHEARFQEIVADLGGFDGG